MNMINITSIVLNIVLSCLIIYDIKYKKYLERRIKILEDIPEPGIKKDPYFQYRDPVTGLLRGKKDIGI